VARVGGRGPRGLPHPLPQLPRLHRARPAPTFDLGRVPPGDGGLRGPGAGGPEGGEAPGGGADLEGFEIDYAHAKLIPLFLPSPGGGAARPPARLSPTYPGYVTSEDGPEASRESLEEEEEEEEEVVVCVCVCVWLLHGPLLDIYEI